MVWALSDIENLANKIGDQHGRLLEDLENEDFETIRERLEKIKDLADEALVDLDEVEPTHA